MFPVRAWCARKPSKAMRPRQTTTRSFLSRAQLAIQPWGAVALLFRSGFVGGRCAADYGADPEAAEGEPVVAGDGLGLRGETGFMENGEQELA